ncbi:MAG: PAS domain-containing protein [Deltaproteobacteria bacterium]|nr:PAS domain-containing protein [Deltaproteobacteria bacterium]
MLNRIVAWLSERGAIGLAMAVAAPATVLAAFALVSVATVGEAGPTPREYALIFGVWALIAAGGGGIAWLIGQRQVRALRDLDAAADAVERGEIRLPPRNAPGGRFAELESKIVRIGKALDERSQLTARTQPSEKLQDELSEEKRRFEAFLRGIGDPVTIVDKEFRIIYVNDTVKKIFGDHTGDHCFKVYEHKTDVCGGCPVRRSMDTGNVEHSLRRVYTRDDKLLYMEATGSPIRDDKGNIIAGIELARDVTQRIKLERSVEIRSRELAVANEELRIANEQLQQAYEELKAAQSALFQSEKMASLGVLVAGVAHEINNPVNFVYGSMPLLDENIRALLTLVEQIETMDIAEDQKDVIRKIKQEIDYEYVQEDLGRIVKNVATGAQRIKEIVQNLRTFSRVDSGENVDMDLHQGIDSTLEILRHEYKNRVEIKKEYSEIPVLIGNPGKMNQVFMNILHNAIQAIETEGKISIRTFVEGPNVVVEIEDSGRGIAPENLGKIFDPFFTTKKVGEGTGLGLSISYSIVQDHNGRLTCRSQVGQGTTFRIELPMREQDMETREQTTTYGLKTHPLAS